MALNDTGSSDSPEQQAEYDCPCGERVAPPEPDGEVTCPECGMVLPLPEGDDGFGDSADGTDDVRRKVVGIVGGAAVAMLAFVPIYLVKAHARSQRQQAVDLAEARELKTEGDELFAGRSFAEAKTSYEEALQMCEGLGKKGHALRDEIRAQLACDDIKFGCDANYVRHGGQWVTKAQRDAAVARFEAQQKAKGLVKFRDKWVKPADRDRLLEEERKAKEEEERRSYELPM